MVDDIGSVIFPAIAGYVFLIRCDYAKPRVVKASGYDVAFLSAAVGLFFFALSWVLVNLPPLEEFSSDLLKSLTGSEASSSLVATYVLTFLLGTLSPPVINHPWRWLAAATSRAQDPPLRVPDPRIRGERDAAASAGDVVGGLLHQAAEQLRHVQLNLASGKVYVGQPATPSQGFDRGVTLFPAVSGYRDPNSQELQLDTDYAWVEGMIGESPEISVPRSEIVMVRMFDLEAYELYMLVSDVTGDLSEMIAALGTARVQPNDGAVGGRPNEDATPDVIAGQTKSSSNPKVTEEEIEALLERLQALALKRPLIHNAIIEVRCFMAGGEDGTERSRERLRKALERLVDALDWVLSGEDDQKGNSHRSDV